MGYAVAAAWMCSSSSPTAAVLAAVMLDHGGADLHPELQQPPRDRGSRVVRIRESCPQVVGPSIRERAQCRGDLTLRTGQPEFRGDGVEQIHERLPPGQTWKNGQGKRRQPGQVAIAGE